MSKHDLHDGEVAFELAGEERVLKPTIEAAQRIDRHFGGYTEALRAVEKLHLDSITFIIQHGLGLRNAKAESLDSKVWREGVGNLAGVAAEYVTILAYGGKRPPDYDEAEPEDEDAEKKE